MDLLRYYGSKILGYINKKKLNKIESFCMFIGYSRSGHSLVGSLLDAHKYICISHELNALHFFKTRYNFAQICYLLQRNSRIFTRQGRIWNTYNYSLPEQYQGKSDNLLVIGDKKGGTSTNLLIKFPDLLSSFCQKLPVPLKIIHVIRNPFDMIATRFLKNKSGYSLENIITRFFEQVEYINGLRNSKNIDILDIYIEELIENPENVLTSLLNFLNVDNYNGYIEDCKSVIFSSPKRTRNSIQWDKKNLEELSDKIREYDFLSHYTFTS